MHHSVFVCGLVILGCSCWIWPALADGSADIGDQEQIHALLKAVQQSVRPANNMRITASYKTVEPSAIVAAEQPPSWTPPHTEASWTVTLNGIRSRIDEYIEDYETCKSTEPIKITRSTAVFDGTMQRKLRVPVTAGRATPRGSQYMSDLNSQSILRRLSGLEQFPLGDLEVLKKWQLSLEPSDDPAKHVIRAVAPYGLQFRLTIDGGRGFGITKIECLLLNGRKIQEIRAKLQKIGDGMWYQVEREKIRYDWRTGEPVPVTEQIVKITKVELDIDVPEETFVLDFPAGAKVWDGIARTWFVVGGVPEDAGARLNETLQADQQLAVTADGNDTRTAVSKMNTRDETDGSAREEKASRSTPAESVGIGRGRWAWILAIVVIAMAMLLTVRIGLYWRRRKTG